MPRNGSRIRSFGHHFINFRPLTVGKQNFDSHQYRGLLAGGCVIFKIYLQTCQYLCQEASNLFWCGRTVLTVRSTVENMAQFFCDNESPPTPIPIYVVEYINLMVRNLNRAKKGSGFVCPWMKEYRDGFRSRYFEVILNVIDECFYSSRKPRICFLEPM